MQACLDQRMIEDGVFLATRHKGEGGQVNEHSSRPILPVKPEQRARRFELMRREIATDSCQPLAQFLPVASVPSVAETAEPLIAVRLTNGRAGAHNLPTLASSVARSADLI